MSQRDRAMLRVVDNDYSCHSKSLKL